MIWDGRDHQPMTCSTLSAPSSFSQSVRECKVSYEIPAFQRPYAWTEEDQWQPLWDDVARIAECLLVAQGDPKEIAALPKHFLGAVVVKQLPSVTGDPARSSVIDGQQPLTTLQLVLDAAQLVMVDLGHAGIAESLQELVLNDSNRFKGTSKRFKLWPSRGDRAAFEHVMHNGATVALELVDTRIVLAHRFFRQCARAWADIPGNPDHTRSRLVALSAALQERLQIVAIDLSGDDRKH
jgi:hypothetical protein